MINAALDFKGNTLSTDEKAYLKRFLISDFKRYANDPLGYATHVLKERYWGKQIEIMEAVRTHQKVMIESGNMTGKSRIGGGLVNWWYDAHNPGICLTTAPTEVQVVDILWKEVRVLRQGRPGLQPKAPRMESSPDHFAHGFTTRDVSSFQGRHSAHVMILFDESCHDDQTEVMTDSGWKLFKDVETTDKLLTMNPETLQAELAVPESLHRAHRKGKMLLYERKGCNFCVTPNHRMWYQKRFPAKIPRYSEWTFEEIQNLKTDRFRIPRFFEWANPDLEFFDMPALQGEKKLWESVKIPADEWFEFLGWYYSEGCLSSKLANGAYYTTAITQKNPEILYRLKKLAQSWGLSAEVYEKSATPQLQIQSRQLAQYLQQFGVGCLEKRIPPEVRNASKRQIKIFLQAYAEGDGYTKDNSVIIYSSNEALAGDVQELALKAGFYCSVTRRELKGKVNWILDHYGVSSTDGFTIHISERKEHISIRTKHLKEVDYDGMIYCATVPPHHLLYTRRKGKAMWSGNTGVSNEFWEAARSMINSPEDRWVCFLNPLDTSSYAYQESQTGNWHVINVSCLDHPNISAELRGELPPIPSAVRLAFVEDAVRSWSEPVTDTILATDLEWPPRSGKYIRPSPIFEARILGMWPSQSVFSLWSKSLIKTCEERRFELPTVEDKVAPEIGCDPARFGDDHSSIFVRWGKSVVVRETYKGCDTTFVAGRLKVLCNEWGVRAGVPVRLVPCKIDVVGLGAGVVDQAGRGDEKYNFIPVNSASSPVRENRYVKRRDELWETTVELAKRGLIEWSRLDKKAKDELSRQLLAPRYEYDGSGRMRVDQKDDVKKRIGRSPDDADALNLCVTSTLYRPERKKQDEGMPKVRYPHFYQTAYALEREGAWKTGHW